jgi:hypothetical protein
MVLPNSRNWPLPGIKSCLAVSPAVYKLANESTPSKGETSQAIDHPILELTVVDPRVTIEFSATFEYSSLPHPLINLLIFLNEHIEAVIDRRSISNVQH